MRRQKRQLDDIGEAHKNRSTTFFKIKIQKYLFFQNQEYTFFLFAKSTITTPYNEKVDNIQNVVDLVTL